MKKLDKKQIPQFVALCVLSSGVFGYFVMRMVTPSEASASSAVRQATPVAAAPTTKADTPVPTTVGAAAGTGPLAVASTGAPTAAGDPAPAVPQPLAGMRDPFVVGYVEPKIAPSVAPVTAPPKLIASPNPQMARATLPGLSAFPAPPAPELPNGLTGFSVRPTQMAPSLPRVLAPPTPAPTWTVTGVLQADTEKVAILRNGEARRIVRSGDFVDSTYQVADVTRSYVVLRHGSASYRLMLGGGKPAQSTTLAPASVSGPPMLTTPPDSAAPKQTAPGQHLGQPGSSALTQAGHSLGRLATQWLNKKRTEPVLASYSQPSDHIALRFFDNTQE